MADLIIIMTILLIIFATFLVVFIGGLKLIMFIVNSIFGIFKR